MVDFSKIYLFRITHIDNIPHILKYGIVHSTSINSNPNFVPIGDESLISNRNNITLNNGRKLGEYIPFYFGYRMPMLYVIQNGFNQVTTIIPENVVYCVSSIQKILDLKLDFVFTDGHAVEKFSTQYSNEHLNDINSILDWDAIKAKYWKDENDLDIKRRKEAEFLVMNDISVDGILGFVTYNDVARDKLISYGAEKSKVFVRQTYYF